MVTSSGNMPRYSEPLCSLRGLVPACVVGCCLLIVFMNCLKDGLTVASTAIKSPSTLMETIPLDRVITAVCHSPNLRGNVLCGVREGGGKGGELGDVAVHGLRAYLRVETTPLCELMVKVRALFLSCRAIKCPLPLRN